MAVPFLFRFGKVTLVLSYLLFRYGEAFCT